MDPSQGPASPLDYRRVPRTRRQIFSWPVFIVGICVILILFGVFGFLFPKIEALYADFGVWLPLPTRVVLDVARFMQMRGLVISSSLPLALGFLVPFALGRRKSPLTRRQ